MKECLVAQIRIYFENKCFESELWSWKLTIIESTNPYQQDLCCHHCHNLRIFFVSISYLTCAIFHFPSKPQNFFWDKIICSWWYCWLIFVNLWQSQRKSNMAVPIWQSMFGCMFTLTLNLLNRMWMNEVSTDT